jgi:hypothetical protein
VSPVTAKFKAEFVARREAEAESLPAHAAMAGAARDLTVDLQADGSRDEELRAPGAVSGVLI